MISLHILNRFFFITETTCVSCAVLTEYLCVTHVYFTLPTVGCEYFGFFLSVFILPVYLTRPHLRVALGSRTNG